MTFLGIDLAASAAHTGLAAVRGDGECVVDHVQVAADDEVSSMRSALPSASA